MKYFLAFVLAFTLAVGASAQNVATTTQSGANNDANVAQTGNNDVTITQTAPVSSAVTSNRADVNQNGDNSGTISQNAGTNTNLSKGNVATLDQDGQQNTASITQSTLTNHAGRGADADVDQDGDGNQAIVSQTGGYTEVAQIEQLQDDNYARIRQSGSDHSEARVFQDGLDNETDVFQRTGGTNYARVEQDGDENYAWVYQDNDVTSVVQAKAWVTQDGFSNEAYVDQSLRTNAEAHVTQTGGDDNVADIDQSNPIQIDPSHYASISQALGSDNYGRIRQTGDASVQNQAWISQTNGDGNAAFLDQQGVGGSHWAQVTQDGSSNRVEGLGGLGTAALQDGAGHTLTVSQTGNGHLSQTGQVGSGNNATVIQN